MREPRTSREALIAEMLGELDELLARAAQLPKSIAEAEARVAITAQVLNDAGEKYRLAVAAFTEQAKVALTKHIQHEMTNAISLSIEEQRSLVHDAARAAFRSELAQAAAEVHMRRKPVPEDRSHSRQGRFVDHCVTAALASALTASLVLAIVKLG